MLIVLYSLSQQNVIFVYLKVYIQCVKIEGTDDPVIQDTNNQLDELTALLTDLNTKAAMYPPLEEVKEGE